MISASRMAAPPLGDKSELAHRVVVKLPNNKRGQASGYGHRWLLLCIVGYCPVGKACHLPKHTVRARGDYTVGLEYN